MLTMLLLMYFVSSFALGLVLGNILTKKRERSIARNQLEYMQWRIDNFAKTKITEVKEESSEIENPFVVNVKKAKNGQTYISLDYKSNKRNFMFSETYKNKSFAQKKALALHLLLNGKKCSCASKVYSQPTNNEKDIIVGR